MSDQPRQVLLLYAESRFLPAIVEADSAFRSTVSSGLGAPVNFRTEFLDLPPTPSAAYERRLWDLLRLKYQDVHLDLIAVFAPRALRFALDYRAELAPGAPIVFMAVDSVGDLELPRDVTGVLMTLDSIDTLGAALRLQPETRRVVVVAGNLRARQALPGLGAGGVCRRAGPARVHVRDGPAAGSGGGETGRPARWDHRVPGLISPGQRRSNRLDARGSGAIGREIEGAHLWAQLHPHGARDSRWSSHRLREAGRQGRRARAAAAPGRAARTRRHRDAKHEYLRVRLAAAQALGAQGESAASGQRDPIPGAVGVGAVPVADHRDAGRGPARVSADRRPGGPAGAAEARGGRGGRAARAARPRPARDGRGGAGGHAGARDQPAARRDREQCRGGVPARGPGGAEADGPAGNAGRYHR